MVRVKVTRMTVEDIKRELAAYERRYGMPSAEFYDKYNAGDMGDSEDVMEWATYFEWLQLKAPQHRSVKA